MSKDILLSKVLRKLAFYWLLAGVGIGLGFFIPPAVASIISLVTFGLLMLSFVVKWKPETWSKLYSIIAVAIGITLKYTLERYVGQMGLDAVIMVFASTIIIFVIMGMIGFKSSRNMSNMGKYLFIALIGMILVSLIGIFVVQSTMVVIVVSAIGTLLFSLYTMYDFNQIAKENFTEEDVPGIAFNLFLDFINLLQHLLSLVNAVSRS